MQHSRSKIAAFRIDFLQSWILDDIWEFLIKEFSPPSLILCA